MRRAGPYRGENPGPARMLRESLNRGPELENSQGQSRSFDDIRAMSGLPPQADLRASLPLVAFVPQPVISKLFNDGVSEKRGCLVAPSRLASAARTYVQGTVAKHPVRPNAQIA